MAIIIDAWRHPQSDGNTGQPFTAEENALLGITEAGVLAARGTGRLCIDLYGADYFRGAMLVCSDTERAVRGMLAMQSGAAEYCRDKGLPEMRVMRPLLMPALQEPRHGSADWTTPKWDWDQPFASTGDTIAKCYERVYGALQQLLQDAIGSRRIVIVCSGHVCRLLVLAALNVGKKYWDADILPNPKNCEGYCIHIGPVGQVANSFLRENGVAVARLPGI